MQAVSWPLGVEYTELRMLLSPGDGGFFTIGGWVLKPAHQVLVERDLEGQEHGEQLDQLLLQISQEAPDPLPLLCLRCRVSHGIEAWIRGLRTGPLPAAMAWICWQWASYGLDNDGRLKLRTQGSLEVRQN